METTNNRLKPLEIRRKDPLSIDWTLLTILDLVYLANNGYDFYVDGDLKSVMFK